MCLYVVVCRCSAFVSPSNIVSLAFPSVGVSFWFVVDIASLSLHRFVFISVVVFPCERSSKSCGGVVVYDVCRWLLRMHALLCVCVCVCLCVRVYVSVCLLVGLFVC